MFKKLRRFIMGIFYKEKRIARDEGPKRTNFVGVQASQLSKVKEVTRDDGALSEKLISDGVKLSQGLHCGHDDTRVHRRWCGGSDVDDAVQVGHFDPLRQHPVSNRMVGESERRYPHYLEPAFILGDPIDMGEPPEEAVQEALLSIIPDGKITPDTNDYEMTSEERSLYRQLCTLKHHPDFCTPDARASLFDTLHALETGKGKQGLIGEINIESITDTIGTVGHVVDFKNSVDKVGVSDVVQEGWCRGKLDVSRALFFGLNEPLNVSPNDSCSAAAAFIDKPLLNDAEYVERRNALLSGMASSLRKQVAGSQAPWMGRPVISSTPEIDSARGLLSEEELEKVVIAMPLADVEGVTPESFDVRVKDLPFMLEAGMISFVTIAQLGYMVLENGRVIKIPEYRAIDMKHYRPVWDDLEIGLPTGVRLNIEKDTNFKIKKPNARLAEPSKNEKRKMSPRRVKKETKKVIKFTSGKHR